LAGNNDTFPMRLSE